MVASNFDGLGDYRTLTYEGQKPIKPYNCCFSRVFRASVCIATYGMFVPSYIQSLPTLCDTQSRHADIQCTPQAPCFLLGEIR